MPRPKSQRHPAPKKPRGASVLGSLGLPASILILVLFLFGAGWWLSYSTYIPTDPETLCRSDQSPESVHLVLLDITDQLSAAERIQIENELIRLRSKMRLHSLLEIYTLRESLDAFREPVFSACNPGDGSDLNRLYQNPDLARNRWNREFVERLESSFESAIDQESGSQSLIFEAIRLLAIHRLTDPTLGDSEFEIIVVSDLLQHRPGVYTHYRRPLESFESFSRSNYYSSVRSNLSNSKIHILYIERPGTLQYQSNEHLIFWRNYFNNQGADVERILRVLGD